MGKQKTTFPVEGRRYKFRSRPWDMSYIEFEEDEEGHWIYDPLLKIKEQPSAEVFLRSRPCDEGE